MAAEEGVAQALERLRLLSAGARSGHWGLPGMRERAARLGGAMGLQRRRVNGARVRAIEFARIIAQ
jgi:nitrate/nitrite-specific signal transduction histidine kinase